MKAKLLKQIRKKFDIVYNNDDKCYIVRGGKDGFRKYKSVYNETKWYLRPISVYAPEYVKLSKEKFAFYLMLCHMGFSHEVESHIVKMYKDKKKKEKQILYKEFKKYSKNLL